MEDAKEELRKLIDALGDYQARYILSLAMLISKLSEYQTRYLIAFVKKRFSL